MTDAVSSKTVIDNPGDNRLVMRFTNLSDGTGEAAVLKVDVSGLNTNAKGEAFTRCKIDWIKWSCSGMAVNILWDATTPTLAFTCPADTAEEMHFVGGIANNAGTGITGDIKFTTVGHTASDAYVIELGMTKQDL